MKKTQKFGSREGATFIEYALLAGLVAIIVAAAAMFFGDSLKQLFGSTSSQTKQVSDNVQQVDLKKSFENVNENPANSGNTSGN